jgi:hypothetical protein
MVQICNGRPDPDIQDLYSCVYRRAGFYEPRAIRSGKEQPVSRHVRRLRGVSIARLVRNVYRVRERYQHVSLIKGTTIDVKLVAGSAGTLIAPSTITLADGLSVGPTSFDVILSNTGAGFAFLELTVKWKGVEYKYYYPGMITLL